MNILIIIGLIALCYFIIYGICRLLSSILVAIKIPWAAVLIGCAAIIINLHQYSFLNYVVVFIAIVLLIRLLLAQVTNTVGKAVGAKKERRQALGAAYASLFSFLLFGALYVNLNYILTVQVIGLSFEEYKEMGIFTGKILSIIGFGPVKWFILALAIIAFIQAFLKTSDLGTAYSSKPQEKQVVESNKSEIKNYYTKIMRIPVFPKENTVEANRIALKQYFLRCFKNQEAKAEKLAAATLNIASLEISEPSEILETLVEDSGLSMEEVLKCFPELGLGSD